MLLSNSKLKNSILVTLSILGVSTVAVVPAYADGANYTTSANVNFTPSQDTVGPVNPDKPDANQPVKPVTPDGNDVKPGTTGPLSLDYVSDFDFGSQKISPKNQTYYAKAQGYQGVSDNSVLYAQVTDSRGTGAGWTLSVAQPSQFMNNGKELKGAQIGISDLSAATQADSDAGSATAGGNMTLIPGTGAQTVMSAKANTGQGTWVARMGKADNLVTEKGDGDTSRTVDNAVSLNVPGSSNKLAGEYTTTLNWTLSDVPSNEK
ncbi:WxL domain-containing protein [Weissella bombi]|uniref:WxL domain surface cell wall-binding n=1 Tax=Weissella bombi TaxID=1505725 RepID=A0A1C4ACI1_9LACO|nr:WxL domain-containing protein [Weissella bombi]SCB92267.1 WxL domain surface cell wall-binding [Weissella bombi]